MLPVPMGRVIDSGRSATRNPGGDKALNASSPPAYWDFPSRNYKMEYSVGGGMTSIGLPPATVRPERGFRVLRPLSWAVIGIAIVSLVATGLGGAFPHGALAAPNTTGGLSVSSTGRLSTTSAPSKGAAPGSPIAPTRAGPSVRSPTGSSASTVSELGNLVATISVGTASPAAAAYDPASGEIYAAEPGTGTVSVLSGTQLVGTISVGTYPASLAYDSADGYVYVANLDSDTVSILSGTTVVGTLSTAQYNVLTPQSITYDSATGEIYVIGGRSATNILVISGTSVVGTIFDPIGTSGCIQYDPSDGYVYVANYTGAVAVYSGTSLITTINTGGGFPSSCGYDPENGYVYITNAGSIKGLSVISGTTFLAGLVVGTGPDGVAYDSANGLVYVPNGQSNNISLISGISVLGSTLPLSGPEGVAYDAGNGGLYVGYYSNGGGMAIFATELSVGTGQDHLAQPHLTPTGSIPVGGAPSASTYDPSDGDLYVANQNTNNVTVISGTTVVGSIPVGTTPIGIAFDGSSGDVYVANYDSNNVSIISGTSVVGKVGVGQYPSAVAFDPVSGDVYVANALSDNVSVISGASVVTSINVGTYPDGIAYDVQDGEIYVANEGSANVTVISGATVMGAVNVGIEPYAVAYNPGNGGIYVTNFGSNSVSEIRGLAVAATLPVGDGPDGVAYDPVTGAMIVADFSGHNLSVVFGSTTVATVAGGNGPEGISVNPLTGRLWVADSYSNAVGVWNSSVNATSALAGSADVGQWLELVAPLVYANPALLDVGVGTSPNVGLTCLPIAPSEPNVTTLCLAGANGTYEVTSNIGDPAGNEISTASWVPIYSDLSNPTVDESRTSADVGQPVDFSVVVSGGAPGPLQYVWTLPVALGCLNPTTAVITCTPDAPVTAGTVRVSVTDVNGFMTESIPLAFTVYSDPTVALPVADPSHLDVGQSLVLSVNVTNASGDPVTVRWDGLPTGCLGTDAMAIRCVPTTPGSYSVSVNLTDANTFATSSGAVVVVVSLALGTPAVTSSASYLDLGQSVALTVTDVGGQAPFTYAWTGLPPGCPPSDAAVLACRPAAVGNYTISVQVTDGNGEVQASGMLTISVDPTLKAVGLELSPAALDLGGSTQISLLTSGGSGGLVYQWFGLPSGCAGGSTLSQISCRPRGEGNYTLSVTITDAAGASVTVGPAVLRVAEGLGTPHVALSAPSTPVGTLVIFTANQTGGLAPYTYEWAGLPSGCIATDSPSIGCVPSLPGNYTVNVTVIDATGARESSGPVSLAVFKARTTAPATSVTAAPGTIQWVALGLAVGALALAAYAVVRRPPRGRVPQTHEAEGREGPSAQTAMTESPASSGESASSGPEPDRGASGVPENR